MSRSLTAAARQRYAPHSLCVLWGCFGSLTAAERFVEAVAGRWERSALDLEEQLHARTPALSRSERLAVSGPRGPRVRGAAGRETQNVPEEERADSEAEVTASSSDRPDLERNETSRLVQDASPRSGGVPRSERAARGRGERKRESARRRPPSVAEGESQGSSVARPGDREIGSIAGAPGRTGLTADGVAAPGAITGSSEPPIFEASRRRRDRVDSHPEVGGAASADGVSAGPAGPAGPAGDVDRWMRTPAVSGHRARPWDPVDDGKAKHRDVRGAASMGSVSASRGDDIDAPTWTPAVSSHRPRSWDPIDDIDESARRRFEAWTLERRWREEAREEWRRWEF